MNQVCAAPGPFFRLSKTWNIAKDLDTHVMSVLAPDTSTVDPVDPTTMPDGTIHLTQENLQRILPKKPKHYARSMRRDGASNLEPRYKSHDATGYVVSEAEKIMPNTTQDPQESSRRTFASVDNHPTLITGLIMRNIPVNMIMEYTDFQRREKDVNAGTKVKGEALKAYEVSISETKKTEKGEIGSIADKNVQRFVRQAHNVGIYTEDVHIWNMLAQLYKEELKTPEGINNVLLLDFFARAVADYGRGKEDLLKLFMSIGEDIDKKWFRAHIRDAKDTLSDRMRASRNNISPVMEGSERKDLRSDFSIGRAVGANKGAGGEGVSVTKKPTEASTVRAWIFISDHRNELLQMTREILKKNSGNSTRLQPEVEDILCDAEVRFVNFAQSNTVDYKDNVIGFMYRTITNTLYDFYRGEKRRPTESLDGFDDRYDSPQRKEVLLSGIQDKDYHEFSNPLRIVMQQHTQYVVGKGIAELSIKQQITLDLKLLGYTQSQIAELTKDPLGTIKTRLRLGMHVLSKNPDLISYS